MRGFGVSLLHLLDEGLHVGREYFFRGLLLLLVDVGGGLADGWGGGVHGWFPPSAFALAFALKSGSERVRIHAERLLAKAGGSKRKGRGISHPWNETKREWKGRSEAEGLH